MAAACLSLKLGNYPVGIPRKWEGSPRLPRGNVAVTLAPSQAEHPVGRYGRANTGQEKKTMAALMTDSLEEMIARRKLQPPESLQSDTIRWLASLPTDVRPTALPIQFVRIANALARVWGDQRRCLEYFDDLLIDRRGGRQGFPFDVALEIAGLKDHYETVVHPMAQTAWDLIIAMKR
jgi:hypothetical protein